MTQPPIIVTDIQVRFTDTPNPRNGVIAWASCVINGSVQLNNISIHRDDDGHLGTRFPFRQGRAGQKFFYCRPLHQEAKRILDDAILARFSRS